MGIYGMGNTAVRVCGGRIRGTTSYESREYRHTDGVEIVAEFVVWEDRATGRLEADRKSSGMASIGVGRMGNVFHKSTTVYGDVTRTFRYVNCGRDRWIVFDVVTNGDWTKRQLGIGRLGGNADRRIDLSAIRVLRKKNRTRLELEIPWFGFKIRVDKRRGGSRKRARADSG